MRRKLLTITIIALAGVMVLGGCKKKVETIPLDETVYITLDVSDGGKHTVYPGTGAVVYGNGDKIYVGNNGKYVGYLTYANGTFSGTLTSPSTSDYLHFYFVGGLEPSATPSAGSTTSFTVNISDQSSNLPVLSYGKSNVKYTSGTAAYTCVLENKCGLVKFVPATPTSSTVTVGGMKNVATVNFASGSEGITPTGAKGTITLYPESTSAKWAILLPQDAVASPTVTISGYTCSISGSVPTVTNNMYYSSGVSISMTATVTLTTTAASDVTNATASTGGTLTTVGTVTERGVVYSTSTSPTTSSYSGGGKITDASAAAGSFTSSLTGLTAGTTYYVRAYAIVDGNTTYGAQQTFATSSYATGYIDATYTVASSTTVKFAQGNLIAVSDGVYGFDANQYDVHTSVPTLSSGYPRYYFTWSEIASSGNNPMEFTIGSKTYKTLTSAQWQYVLGLDDYARGGTSVSASGHFYAKAVVNGINGLILLPDNWSDSNYTLSNYNTTNAAFTGNTITSTQWTTLESEGCVFLPVAGNAYGSSVYYATTDGYYWSSTEDGSSYAYYLGFDSSYLGMDYNSKTDGYSVRLVLAN